MTMLWADPASTFTRRELIPGSCSPVAYQCVPEDSVLAERFILQVWKARAQGLLPVPVPVPLPSIQPSAFREHSPNLKTVKAVAKRLLFSLLFSQCT